MSPIQAVIFDMGGVVVDLGPISGLLGTEAGSVDGLWQRWLASPAVREFEMGRCSVEDFGSRLVVDLDLAATGEQIVQRFNDWPRGLFPGAAAMVRSLDGSVEVGLLSNTNALHWFGQTDHEEIRALFGHTYLSFELGMVKPDTQIFEHVLDDLGVEPGLVLFLDDNRINVEAARTSGICAEVTQGVAEARSALRSYGLTPS